MTTVNTLPTTTAPSCLDIALPSGRHLAVPAVLPLAVIVIVILACGHDIASATAAVVAIGAAARDLARTS
ncbi:hypothetical protein [Streptomyces sp. NRRL S-495]|uniref:hypothetical protein n=1 Tax=Streptomyces sp. NRRL S-495 TaxID=1609133 RepID=UPI0005F8AF43|nr:hypothetical protein [Streptomyces sp. NRRL S-495]KJY32930.1 hypothetical protein VR45_21215 [Streptomyces sp. NRRL S-495]